MSRRREATKRKVLPDTRYKSVLVSKFINLLMKNGKKSVAKKIVYAAMDLIAEKGKKVYQESQKQEKDHHGRADKISGANPQLALFEIAIDKIKPRVEVRSRRVGGATYQVPVEVTEARGITLAFRWILDAARNNRNEKGMDARLTGEILDILAGRGAAMKKREDTHKMALANRAFAHLNWIERVE